MAAAQPTLNPADKQIIRNAIGHQCQIFTATIIRLYFAYPDPGRWTLAVRCGAIAFMKDSRRNNAFFFRLVDLNRRRIVWEQELYKDFEYFQERTWFHTFATDVYLTVMAGFSFANEKEALGFFTKVMTRESLRVAPKSRPQSTVAASASPAAAQQTSANNTSASGGGGLFGSGKKKKKKLDKSLIGAPSNFKHLTHVGYSQDSGYSVMNVPPEWKSVFQDAGITEEQLKDKNTAAFIMDFMEKHNPPATGQAQPPALPDREQSSQDPAQAPRRPPPPVPTRPSAQVQGVAPRGPPPAPPGRRAPAPEPPTSNKMVLPEVPKTAPEHASSSRIVLPEPPKSGPPPTQVRSPPPAPPTRRISPPSITVSQPTAAARPPAVEENFIPPAPTSVPAPPPVPAAPPMAPAAPPLPPVATTQPVTLPRPSGAPKPAPVFDSRNDLLASIRSAGGKAALKPASERQLPASASNDGLNNDNGGSSGNIADALKNALQARLGAMRPAEDESDEEDEEDEDW